MRQFNHKWKKHQKHQMQPANEKNTEMPPPQQPNVVSDVPAIDPAVEPEVSAVEIQILPANPPNTEIIVPASLEEEKDDQKVKKPGKLKKIPGQQPDKNADKQKNPRKQPQR